MNYDKNTGNPISEQEHIRQSIDCILSTPLGSRVMNPTFGSRLYSLLDKTITDRWIIEAIEATTEAIERNEARVDVQRVDVQLADDGQIGIELQLQRLDSGASLFINNLQVAA